MKDKIGHDLKNIAQKINGITYIIESVSDSLTSEYDKKKIEASAVTLKSIVKDLDGLWIDINNN